MIVSGKKYTLLHLVLIPFRCAPISSIVIALLTVGDMALTSVKLFASAAFIDAAIASAYDGDWARVFPPLLAVAAAVAYENARGLIRQLTSKDMELRLRSSLRASIVEKQAKLDYRHVEDHETWDLISRVAKEPEVRFRDGMSQTLSGVSLIGSIASIVVITAVYSWWVALLLIAVCSPMLVIAAKGGKKQYDAEKDASKYSRRHEYLFEVLNARENVEERALFGYVERLVAEFARQFEAARIIFVRMQAIWMARSKAASVGLGVAQTVVFIVLAVPLAQGKMTAGVMIALIQSIMQMTGWLSWQLSYLADRLANNNEYMKDLTKFAALSETPGAILAPARGQELHRLEFRNVRFKYPGTERYILDGLSFVIEGGKHYSFVGANGAGKTTITKLITGLYSEYEGEILINGEDVKTISNERLKGAAVCVFQDFARYQITVGENVALGCAGCEDEDARVEAAVSSVGLSDAVAALPKGLDTPLGKIAEDGQDLSGGQWQRVALARAVTSPAPLRILDEPTAALDPMAESEVYRQFEQISRGVTTIFISHRLGSTKLADEIFVIDGGKIVERGTHERLAANGALYAEMFESQRSWYQ